MRLTALSAAVAGVGLILLACQDQTGDDASRCGQRPVRMAVASSLREIAVSLRQELLRHAEPVQVELVFGASSVHARQISLGAPMDVLVSADAKITDALLRRGLLAPHSKLEFARGRLVLATRGQWSSGATGPAVLESSAMNRIAIPAASVPLGRYARSWLEHKGLLDRLAGRIVTTEHARATLAAVDGGHVDAAILYESDARLARNAQIVVRIEPSEYPPIRYVAARVTAAPQCAAIDRALASWMDPAILARLASAGFNTEPPTKNADAGA